MHESWPGLDDLAVISEHFSASPELLIVPKRSQQWMKTKTVPYMNLGIHSPRTDNLHLPTCPVPQNANDQTAVLGALGAELSLNLHADPQRALGTYRILRHQSIWSSLTSSFRNMPRVGMRLYFDRKLELGTGTNIDQIEDNAAMALCAAWTCRRLPATFMDGNQYF